MEKRCALCKRTVDSETAEILVMGGYANPKYLCEDCSFDVEEITTARSCDVIKAAMARVGEKMAECDITDRTVLDAIDTIFTDAKERAEKIQKGTYDFSSEEAAELLAEDDDVPEELRETEEDKALDEKDRRIEKRVNRVLDVFIAIGVLALVVFIILYFIER